MYILLLFSKFCTVILNFQSEAEPPTTDDYEGGEYIWIALALVVICLFVVRYYMKRYVLRLMNKTSEKATYSEPLELQVSEKKAKHQPTFIELDHNSKHETAIALREDFVKNAFLLFRKKYFYGILGCLLYFILPLILGKLGGDDSMNEDLAAAIMGLPIIYFIYISLVYLFHRKQFRAENANFGVRFEHPVRTLLRRVVNPEFEKYFTIIFIITMISIGFTGVPVDDGNGNITEIKPSIWVTIGYVLAGVIHAYLIIKIRRQSQQVSNTSLLILRVFGGKKQVQLTFGKLTQFWKHIGSWFTIVDPSFIGRQYRTFTLKSLLTIASVFIGAFFVVILLSKYIVSTLRYLLPIDGASDSEIEVFFMIPSIILAWALYFKYWKFKISRSYAKDHDGIKSKIAKVMDKPRKQDMTFKNLPMFCFDNTWKLAVSEFIKNSKVILMDLRGFSSERKGCEYEIDFLLDTFKINGILFLVDEASDKQLVQSTINERWEYLRINSPNINLDRPEAKIFVSKMQDENEVQTLIDHLIEAANNTN
jgi:hypothetical protein